MKIRTTSAFAGVVGLSVAALVLAGCSSTPSTGSSASSGSSKSDSSGEAALTPAKGPAAGEDSSTNFVLGELIPLTGSLAAYGPAAVGSIGSALSDINAAGGVNGKPARFIQTDSGDTSNLQTFAEPNAKKLISANVSAILGAYSSGVSMDVLPTVNSAGIVMFSPANTAGALSGASQWYFRDPVENDVEAQVLASQISKDGHKKVAILVDGSDSYSTDLRSDLEKYIKKEGLTITYGAEGSNQEFSPTGADFNAVVKSALATSPDSVIIDAEAVTSQILPALQSAQFNFKNAYFVDGNLSDYGASSSTPFSGDLTGAQGTAQGAVNSAYQKKVTAWLAKNDPKNKGNSVWGYAPEAYDATVIMALAADLAGSNKPADFAKYIMPITGSKDAFTPANPAGSGTVTSTLTKISGQTDCTSYAACLKLIKGGNKNIHYVGYAKVGPINSAHDPSTGYVTLYKYGKDNAPQVEQSINSADLQ